MKSLQFYISVVMILNFAVACLPEPEKEVRSIAPSVPGKGLKRINTANGEAVEKKVPSSKFEILPGTGPVVEANLNREVELPPYDENSRSKNARIPYRSVNQSPMNAQNPIPQHPGMPLQNPTSSVRDAIVNRKIEDIPLQFSWKIRYD